MTTIVRIAVALCLTLAVACGDDADDGNEVRESIRDSRYCEFATLFLGPDGITSDSWNTSGLNDCPAADWEALDFEAIRQELGATILRPNGPRHWLFDAGVQHGSDEAERRFFGNIEFGLVAHVQYDFVPPPPGNFFFEVAVERATEFLFYKNRPVYEVLAPLGKRYVMQSYAQIVDPTLTLADLDSILPRISLPEGWEYRVGILSEDLVVDDFQGFATAMRDALENTYQRAEALEYLPAGRLAVEIFNGSTMQSWTTFMSEQEAGALEVSPPWRKSDQIVVADKSVYSRSPEAEVDGRFDQMTIAGFTFSLSGLAVDEPEFDSSGLILTGQSRKFHELTYRAGRSIPYVRNPRGEDFVLVSNAPDAVPEPGMLPAGWSHGEVQLSDDWRVVFEGSASTVETVDGARIYQGPVSLPGAAG